MSKLFIDANYIISIFREADSNHEKAIMNKGILLNNSCYISNGILNEIITILMMRTKNLELTKKAYYFLENNFNIVNEYKIKNFNDKVFSVFKKYNDDNFRLSFIDCSIVIISKYYGLDKVVTFDSKFKLFNEIKLMKFN